MSLKPGARLVRLGLGDHIAGIAAPVVKMRKRADTARVVGMPRREPNRGTRR